MVVRMRSNRSHTGNRRSHHALEAARITSCDNCGKPKRAHYACANCGKYRGKVVIDVEQMIAKKQKKLKEKQTAAAK